jgi:site-specific recombinase XerD
MTENIHRFHRRSLLLYIGACGEGKSMQTDPAQLLTDWLEAPLGELAVRTCLRYRSAVQGFLGWFAEGQRRPLTLADLHPITLVGYRSWLQQRASASSVNTHLCALRTWCAWLTEKDYLQTNPAARLKLVGRQEPLAPCALTPAQVNALLRQAQHTRYPTRNLALLQMLVQTGLRIGECAVLTWQDITFGERQGSVRVRAGKGNKSRQVPLNDSARQALADYVAPLLSVSPTLRDVSVAWAASGRGASPLWTSERGSPLSVREMSRMVAELVHDCAARDAVPVQTTPHSLRHTFATRYLMRHPGDIVGLARLLGHTSIQTTQIYVQPTDAEIAERVNQIDLNAYAG